MGDHGELVFRRRPAITDQQSKVFSKPDPSRFRRIAGGHFGAPPAEYVEKTSVVINVTTRSGEGVTTPKGTVTASYGQFRHLNLGFNLAMRREMGNFVSASGLNTAAFSTHQSLR